MKDSDAMWKDMYQAADESRVYLKKRIRDLEEEVADLENEIELLEGVLDTYENYGAKTP